jgi:hypothetical protein
LGGANIFFPLYLYLIFFGIAIYLLVIAIKNYPKTKIFLWPFSITAIAATAYFANKNLTDFSPQGRHLFLLMIPLGLIVYLSLSTLKPLWQRVAGIFMIVFVFVSSLFGLWLTVDKYYVKGTAYINQSNFGKNLADFSWKKISIENYHNLVEYIFNGNPIILNRYVVLAVGVILLLAIIITLFLISKNSPPTNGIKEKNVVN